MAFTLITKLVGSLHPDGLSILARIHKLPGEEERPPGPQRGVRGSVHSALRAGAAFHGGLQAARHPAEWNHHHWVRGLPHRGHWLLVLKE